MKRKYKRPEDAPQEYWANGGGSSLSVPPGSREFLSLPRVCIGGGSYSSTVFVFTIARNKGDVRRPLFLWAIYRHAFESDDSLPEFNIQVYEDRHMTMEDVVRYVKDGKLAECAIPLAMELLL